MTRGSTMCRKPGRAGVYVPEPVTVKANRNQVKLLLVIARVSGQGFPFRVQDPEGELTRLAGHRGGTDRGNRVAVLLDREPADVGFVVVPRHGFMPGRAGIGLPGPVGNRVFRNQGLAGDEGNCEYGQDRKPVEKKSKRGAHVEHPIPLWGICQEVSARSSPASQASTVAAS